MGSSSSRILTTRYVHSGFRRMCCVLRMLTYCRLIPIDPICTLNEKKGVGVILLAGLLEGAYSRARSHYCSTRELLAARFPSWPVSLLLRQPGSAGFLQPIHVDAKLSADTCSTQATIQQDSQPQASHYTKPPGSRIIGTRHIPGEYIVFLLNLISVKRQGTTENRNDDSNTINFR